MAATSSSVTAAPGRSAMIEGELGDLRACHRAVATQMALQKVGDVRGRPQPVLGQECPDQTTQRRRLVAVAGQGGGARGILDQLAQARAAAEIARLEDDETLLRRQGQEVADRRRGEVAGVAHPDQPPPAHQAQGLGLLDQTARRGAQLVGRQLAHPERVAQIVDHFRRQRPGPLGDQAGIRAIDQDRGDPGVRSRQEALDRLRLELHAARSAK